MMATPYALIALEETESTQDVAREAHAGGPVLVVASRQTRGRGRHGRAWESAPRALAASLAFVPSWPSETWPRIPLMAGMAALSVLRTGLSLKWPNDVVRERRKVAGLLAESAGELLVVGMGVNLWWPNAPAGYGSLDDDDPGDEAGRTIAARWAEDLLRRVQASPDEWGRDEYRDNCSTLGCTIAWEPGGRGLAVDVDADGALLVETREGRRRLLGEEVREIRELTLP
jgi:BirA family biotin operon repressor/biotin-[acetyl-CoA-carboxylase] ligase